MASIPRPSLQSLPIGSPSTTGGQRRSASTNTLSSLLQSLESTFIFSTSRASRRNFTRRRDRFYFCMGGPPGSFVEFQKVIPLLTDPAGDTNFELVIPSLPGFGFSEGAHRPGLGPVEMAQIFKKLMARLGYEKYYVQGGDWGSVIASNMASLYPQHISAIHLNLCFSQHSRTVLRMLLGSLYPPFVMDAADIDKVYPLSSLFSHLMEEGGYFHIQATKPDTVGVALSNSPSGLAAWILEKFSTGTNLAFRNLEDGGLLTSYKVDELLDNVMLYWVTNSMTTAMRIYSEVFTERTMKYGLNNVPVQVPTGCLSLRHEGLSFQNEYLLQDKYPQLLKFTRGDKGGHFAAFEVPEVFVANVRSFVDAVEKAST